MQWDVSGKLFLNSLPLSYSSNSLNNIIVHMCLHPPRSEYQSYSRELLLSLKRLTVSLFCNASDLISTLLSYPSQTSVKLDLSVYDVFFFLFFFFEIRSFSFSSFTSSSSSFSSFPFSSFFSPFLSPFFST